MSCLPSTSCYLPPALVRRHPGRSTHAWRATHTGRRKLHACRRRARGWASRRETRRKTLWKRWHSWWHTYKMLEQFFEESLSDCSPGGALGIPGGGLNPGGRPCGRGGMPIACKLQSPMIVSSIVLFSTYQQGSQAAYHPEASGSQAGDQQEGPCHRAVQSQAARCSTSGCSQIVPPPRMNL